jgi:hypothetical protein
MQEMFHNNGLNDDIDFIIEKMKTIESRGNKMACCCIEEPTFYNPHGIDVEDESYWYEDEDKRDEDYQLLNKILTNKSDNFLYKKNMIKW